jgi:hypothetical protein
MSTTSPPNYTPARLTPTGTVLTPISDDTLRKREKLFEKLVAIGSRSRECLRNIATLTNDEDAFAQLIAQAEEHVRGLPQKTEERRIVSPPTDARIQPLCSCIADSGPLRELVAGEPSLSVYAAREVATLATMADLRPHPELMLEASDGPFMRILRHRAQPGTSTSERIIFEDFVKLIAIRDISVGVLERLWPVAADNWAQQSALLERALLSGRPEPDMTTATLELFSAICTNDDDGAKVAAALTELLRRTPLLSEMLAEEILAFEDLYKKKLPDATSLLANNVYGSMVTATKEEEQRRLAKYVYDHIDTEVRADIFARLELRQWAANYCLELRAFVKLNALERQWPELSRMLRSDRATLKALEGEAMRPGTIAPEHKAIWERYQKDEQLRKFLVVKPLVTDINPSDVRHYFSVSETMMSSPEPHTSTLADSSPTPSSAPRVRFNYVNLALELTVTSSSEAKTDEAPQLPTDISIELHESGKVTESKVVGHSWRALQQLLPSLEGYVRDAATISRGLSREAMPATSVAFSEALLRDVGNLMAQVALKGEVGERLRALHRTDAAYRIRLRIDPALASLPWEALHLEQERVFLGLTQRYSMLRYMKPNVEIRRTAITAPLRILAVLSNPDDTAPLNLEGERSVLEEALGAARTDGRVSLEFLERDDATIENLQRKLRMVRPHVFHFVGHGVFHGGSGALAFREPSGGREVMFLSAEKTATLLRDVGVGIAVLNSCDTGTSAHNDAITGVAGSLVHAGVPAVIATLRAIPDEAGLSFTSELYRAFAEGYTLEAALAEARKRLSVEGWDWSAYTLFANTTQLETLVFPQSASMRKS